MKALEALPLLPGKHFSSVVSFPASLELSGMSYFLKHINSSDFLSLFK